MNHPKHHEFFSNLEDYLQNTLAEETLSAAAQIRRIQLLDSFYALQFLQTGAFKPLGKRPSILTSVSIEVNRTIKSDLVLSKEARILNGTNGINRSTVQDAKDDHNTSQNFYEEPILLNGSCNQTSDRGSDTEYESYEDDDDEEEALDEDSACSVQIGGEIVVRDEIQLPRLNPNKKHKKEFRGVEDLDNVVYMGELYHKGLLSWTKRCCVIRNHRLLCYRSERDSKPIHVVKLSGCDVVYLGKEGKLNHILRLSRAAGDTNWFYADTKDVADSWIKHLVAVSGRRAARKGHSGFIRVQNDSNNLISDKSSSGTDLPNMMTQSGASSSETGSGDGVVSEKTGTNDTDRKPVTIDQRKKSKLGGSLQTFLGTFSKKRGDRLRREFLESGDQELESHVAGYVNIWSDLAAGKKWVKRFCVVKNGRLDCYCDPLDEYIEFSLLLAGAQLDFDDKQLKKELAVKIIQDYKEIFLEAFNEIDFGRWAKSLIKETGWMLQNNRSIQDDTDIKGKTESADVIYDEVYNWQVYSEPGAASAVPAPPPLPKLFPPKTTGQCETSTLPESCGENDYIEPRQYKDGSMFDDEPLQNNKDNLDDSLDLEAAVNSAFFHIREGFNRVDRSPARERSSSLSPASLRKDSGSPAGRSSRLRESTSRSAVVVSSLARADSNASDVESTSVVKCHTGPTIAEDKELLDTTQNPLLLELRKQKERKGTASANNASSIQTKTVPPQGGSEDLTTKKHIKISPPRNVQVVPKKSTEMEILEKKLEEARQDVVKLSKLVHQTVPVQDTKSEPSSRSRLSPASDKKPILSVSPAPMGSIQAQFLRLSQQSASMRSASKTSSLIQRSESLDRRTGSNHPPSSYSSFHSQAGKQGQAERRASFLVNGYKSENISSNGRAQISSKVTSTCISKTSSWSSLGSSTSTQTVMTKMVTSRPTSRRTSAGTVFQTVSVIQDHRNFNSNDNKDTSNLNTQDSDASSGNIVQEKRKMWESIKEPTYAL